MRRSLIAAIGGIAILIWDRARAIGCPWKFPAEIASPSAGKRIGLSVTASSSRPMIPVTFESTSRDAPWTGGAQRTE